MKPYEFRKSQKEDLEKIWEILQQAIERRRKDGSKQWQDGYPNQETIQTDFGKGFGFVLTDEDEIIGYVALIENYEPAYEKIKGKWLSEGNFLVVHRVAVSDKVLEKGIATKIFEKIEDYTKSQNIPSIKVDTNFDNPAMLRILEKLGYQYCGEVEFRGSSRKAFEKLLN